MSTGSKNAQLTPDFEFRTLAKLFFLFGFGIMSWIPRFPDIKAQLGVSNGQFGSLLSVGNIGGFVSLIVVGHIVHKFGSYLVLMVSTISLYITYCLIVFVTSSWLFLILIFSVGFAISAFHISVNSQAFDSQTRISKPIVVKLHGIWTLGAVLTGLLSGFLIGRVSASSQLVVIYIVVLILKIYFINKLRPKLLKADLSDDHFSITKSFKSIRFDGLIAGGLICAMAIEIAMGDWASIFGREYLGIKGGLITLPYVLFMSALIIGRLSISKIIGKFPINTAANFGAFAGGSFFAIGILTSILIGDLHSELAFAIFTMSCFLAGLGTSFIAPSFFNAASSRRQLPSSVVIGQVGLINNLFIFGGKWVVAWTAQFTSLAVALLIPALMAIAIPLFSRALLSGDAKGQALK